MKYYIFLALILLASCNKKQITDFDTKADLVTYLEKLDEAQRTNFLSNQASEINKNLEKANETSINFNFSISGSVSINSENDSLNFIEEKIEEKPFIFVDKDSVKTQLTEHINNIKGYQKFALPNSTFNFFDSGNFEKADDVSYSYNKVYHAKKEIDSSKIGITPIDSIYIAASLTYPISYDSLIITKPSEKIIYKNFEIEIDTLTNNEIIFDLPNELYSKYIDIRGITKNGEVVASNSYSATPNLGLNLEIQNLALKTQKLFEKYSKNDLTDEQLKKFETEFTDLDFESIKALGEFQSKILPKFMKILEKDDDFWEKFKKAGDYIDENSKYFGATSQTINASFPNNIASIVVYFETESQKIYSEKMVYIHPDMFLGYHSFYDEDSQLYGIVDSTGQIVIKPSLKHILQKSNLYYRDTSEEVEYFLDINKKEVKPLSKELAYFETVTKNADVFYKNKKKGVLQNTTVEIVPFKYNNISFINNTYVCEFSLRGRTYLDFYSATGHLIKTEEIIMDSAGFAAVDDKTFVVKNNKRKHGVIDTAGKTIIPFIYDYIQTIGINSLIEVHNENEDAKIIDLKGNTYNLPAKIYRIQNGKLAENRIPFYTENRVFGYLDKNLKIVIPAQYENVTEFNNGFALAIDFKNNFFIIDTIGNKITQIKGINEYYNEPETVTDKKTRKSYFNVDNRYYDMNGKQVDSNKLYLN